MQQQNLSILVFAPTSVALYSNFPVETFHERKAESGLNIELVHTYEEVQARIGEADVYFGARLDAADFRRARRLRWVHVPLAGIDLVLSPDLAASSCLLTNSRGCMAVAVAEHALGSMLYFSRGFDIAVAGQQAGRWENVRARRMPMELADLSVGLVGFGEIGRELAARCKGLGMKVYAMRRREGVSDAPDLVEQMWGPGHLDELIDASTFLVLAAPSLPDTQKLIGERELKRMGPNRFLINIARGPLVDEDALARALHEGWIGGAALDVFEKEPLPAESPLWKAPNLLLTPHIAGQTPHFWERVVGLFFRNLDRFIKGEPLEKLVDKAQGY